MNIILMMIRLIVYQTQMEFMAVQLIKISQPVLRVIQTIFLKVTNVRKSLKKLNFVKFILKIRVVLFVRRDITWFPWKYRMKRDRTFYAQKRLITAINNIFMDSVNFVLTLIFLISKQNYVN